MTALGQHIRIRLRDSRVIASTPRKRRKLARVVLQQAHEDDLLAFGLADTHLHLGAACSEVAGNQLTRRIELSLGYQLALKAGFAPAYSEPIRDGRHLYNTFKYIIGQNARHGLEWDPGHEASNLPDLLGLRVLGTYTAANVRRLLPRVKRESLLEYLGVRELAPADEPLEWVLEAAMAAAGLPDLVGSSQHVIEARRAVIRVVGHRLRPKELAALLGIGRRTVSWLRATPAREQLVQAIHLQLGLMAQRGGRAVIDAPFVATASRSEG